MCYRAWSSASGPHLPDLLLAFEAAPRIPTETRFESDVATAGKPVVVVAGGGDSNGQQTSADDCVDNGELGEESEGAFVPDVISPGGSDSNEQLLEQQWLELESRYSELLARSGANAPVVVMGSPPLVEPAAAMIDVEWQWDADHDDESVLGTFVVNQVGASEADEEILAQEEEGTSEWLWGRLLWRCVWLEVLLVVLAALPWTLPLPHLVLPHPEQVANFARGDTDASGSCDTIEFRSAGEDLGGMNSRCGRNGRRLTQMAMESSVSWSMHASILMMTVTVKSASWGTWGAGCCCRLWLWYAY